MPTYRYSATDAGRDAVSGELEAASAEDALKELTARGLETTLKSIWEVAPTPEPSGQLSERDAAEVAARIAELADAGLPLGPGLRAAAAELGSRRVSRVLRELAGQLEAGATLEAAVAVHGRRFPPHIRMLIFAGVQSGRLPETLGQLVSLEHDRVALQRRIWRAMAYPGLLLAVLLAVLLFFSVFVIPGFHKIYIDFDADMPPITQLVVSLSGPRLGILAGLPALLLYALLFLSTIHLPVWARRVLYAVPVLGPLWRMNGLVAFSRLLGVLLRARIPLPDALRVAAAGLHDHALAVACRRVAWQVREGRPLSESLRQHWQFPPTLDPFVRWGERKDALPEALDAVAETFEYRLRVQISLFEMIAPAIVFILIVASLFFLIIGLMMPLISLIQNVI